MEYTATASSPSSWQARTMRRAISPRLAIRTRFKGRKPPWSRTAGGRRGVPEEEKQAAAEQDVVAGGGLVDAANVLHPRRTILVAGLEQLYDAERVRPRRRWAAEAHQAERHPRERGCRGQIGRRAQA